MNDSELKRFLLQEVELGSFPGFSYLVGEKEQILECGSGGYKTIIPNKEIIENDTIFDLASITKPICTATILLKMHEEKAININNYIDYYLPGLKKLSNKKIKIRDLMSHCAGFRDWYPLFIYGNSIEEYVEIISKIPLEYRVYMRTKYSCLGYIILGATIKKITNKNVKELFNTLIIDKLHLKNTFLHSNKDKIAKTAATENGSHYEQKMAKDMGLEFNNWRKYLIRGEVHDSNSYFADSETGNAGLFSTIYDLFKIAQLYYIDSEFFSSETAKLLYSNNTEFSDEHWSLGWKLATSKDSIGKILSENAIGHTGFTGCSIWIEPFAKKVYILLTNRIHPQVNNVEMNKIRAEFHKLAKKLYG